VDVIIYLAIKGKGVPEEYNTFLHGLHFQPASILHRIDALSYALQFVRYVSSFFSLFFLLLYTIFSFNVCQGKASGEFGARRF
jgi:hypothetical protein